MWVLWAIEMWGKYRQLAGLKPSLEEFLVKGAGEVRVVDMGHINDAHLNTEAAIALNLHFIQERKRQLRRDLIPRTSDPRARGVGNGRRRRGCDVGGAHTGAPTVIVLDGAGEGSGGLLPPHEGEGGARASRGEGGRGGG